MYARPYDFNARIPEQVYTSIESSLYNLRSQEKGTKYTAYLDAVLLQRPFSAMEDTWLAWRAMERYVPRWVRHLGICNVSIPELEEIYHRAVIKPSIVQNGFCADSKYDARIRAFCRDKGIIYQSFWTLTANPGIVRSHIVVEVAQSIGLSLYEALYILVLGLDGITILNGTTSELHMANDNHSLIMAREHALRRPADWARQVNTFKILIGDTIWNTGRVSNQPVLTQLR